jgi:oxaloacetate decarboxylase alpha subunit
MTAPREPLPARRSAARPTVALVDTSLRDGNQSLWGATGLNAAMLEGAAALAERVGFSVLDFTTSTHMAVAVRWHREDPWETIRRVRAAMPSTPLSFLTTGMRFISWEMASDEVMGLAFRLLGQAGIRRFAVMEPMNDVDAQLICCRLVRRETDASIVAAITFTVSPVHDDPYYARLATRLAADPVVDALYLKDPGGLLTAERARTLLPRMVAACAGKPFELHSHETIGLAQFSYAEAPRHGVASLHTAVAPLSGGASQPDAEQVVCNLEVEGIGCNVDRDALASYSAWLVALAQAEGQLPGAPSAYDARYFRHQLPGGMIGTMRRQMRELRQEHRWQEVIEEVERVRAELGYPIMVTPFSQIVGTQAVMNVVGARRYESVADQVIRYVIGRFGKPPCEVAPDVRDRIASLPRAKELLAEPPMPPVAELRRRLGMNLSDEELLLRATMPAEQVDAMKAAGPAPRRYDPYRKPLMALLERLLSGPGAEELRVEAAGVRLVLRGSGAAR